MSGGCGASDTMVETTDTEITARTVIFPRKRANLARIGGRPPLVRVRIVDEVFDMVANVSAVLAIDRPGAVDPHFLNCVPGQPQPGGGLLDIKERLFALLRIVPGHLQSSTVAPRRMRAREAP